LAPVTVAFLQILISGISLGCIYALIALGFVLIYKATETVNFAQGELMMLGAFAGLALMEVAHLPFLVAAVLAIAAMAAFGVTELEVSPWALREGIILRYLDHLE